jgi:SHS2 domain-containing protein
MIPFILQMYTILPHTADIRLQVMDKDPESLFRSAMQGMAYIQRHDFCAKSLLTFSVTQKIELHAGDMTSLLIDFLSEVLTLSHIHKAIFCTVKFDHLSSRNLIALVYGEKVDETDEDIKAVTYHEAEITMTSEGDWMTMIIFDI